MPITRRTFLKAGLVVPVAASLPGGLAALAETVPVEAPVAPVLEPVVAKVCTNGSWRGFPVGWARFTDWNINCPPIGTHADDWELVEWGSVEEFLTVTGLTEEQRAHATGSCSHGAKGMDDIVAQNQRYWRRKRKPGSYFEKFPMEMGMCHCEGVVEAEVPRHKKGKECEWCALVSYRPPDQGLPPHGAG